jgi:voltage-gated potassium channel Kch
MSRLMRPFIRFSNNPSSIRYAATAIIATIVVLVLLGAVLLRVLTPDEYASFGDALWFTLQTVTTVGYGDDTPTSAVGRIIASVVMLVSIGLVTVITAAVTSLFISSVSREQERWNQQDAANALARIEEELTEAHDRLERIERRITGQEDV